MPVDLLAEQDQQTGISSDESRIMGVLNQNSDKNFVQRILKPKGKPTLDLGGDNFATHKMSWTTADGKSIVYPKVIQDPKTEKLVELSSKDAIQHALKNNEFITAKDGKDAEWLSSNYKKVWNMDGKNISLKPGLSTPQQQPIDLLAGMPKPAIPAGTVPGAGTIFQQIQREGGAVPVLKQLGRQVTAIPVGFTQQLGKLAAQVPGGSRLGLAALANLALRHTPQAIQRAPQAAPAFAKVGRGLADIAGFGGAAIAATPLAEAIGLPGLLARPAAQAAGGAFVSPGHRVAGGTLGALAGTGGELLKGGADLVRNLPNLFMGKLAKNIARTAENQKQIGNQLYKDAFRGTEKITPTVSQQTGQSIKNLQELFPGKQSSVNRALNAFQRNPNLEGLHGLRSDLSKVSRKIGDKAVKSGLDSNQIDQQEALGDTVDNLTLDTQKNLSAVSPRKAGEYEMAQQHWKNNVIPFRNLNSIKKLLGTEKEVSPSLFRDIARESVSAQRLRKLTGVPKGIAQTGEFLHRKYLGIPIGIWLTGGVGSSLTFGKHFL